MKYQYIVAVVLPCCALRQCAILKSLLCFVFSKEQGYRYSTFSDGSDNTIHSIIPHCKYTLTAHDQPPWRAKHVRFSKNCCSQGRCYTFFHKKKSHLYRHARSAIPVHHIPGNSLRRLQLHLWTVRWIGRKKRHNVWNNARVGGGCLMGRLIATMNYSRARQNT